MTMDTTTPVVRQPPLPSPRGRRRLARRTWGQELGVTAAQSQFSRQYLDSSPRDGLVISVGSKITS
jgi:hypothetical protein